MNCDGVRGLLSAYLDSQLSPGELLRTEQHLRRCHGCAMEVDSLRQTIALVSSLDEVEVPASFHASLHARLVAVGPPVATPVGRVTAIQRGFRNWALSAAAAAAAAAMLTVGLLQWPRVAQELPGILAKNGPVAIDSPVTSSPVGTPPTYAVLEPAPSPVPSTQPVSATPPNPVGSPVVAIADGVNQPDPTVTPPEGDPGAPKSVPESSVNSDPITTVPPTIGSVVQTKLSAHAVSYLSGVTRVTSEQTKVSYTHSFLIQTNTAELLAAELVGRFGGLAQSNSSSSSVIITLPKADLADGLRYVKLLLGEKAIEAERVESDYTASLQLAEELMVKLDAARERRYQDALDLGDSEDLDLIMRELDDYLHQFEIAKVDLARLQRQATQDTIIVTLQKQVQSE